MVACSHKRCSFLQPEILREELSGQTDIHDWITQGPGSSWKVVSQLSYAFSWNVTLFIIAFSREESVESCWIIWHSFMSMQQNKLLTRAQLSAIFFLKSKDKKTTCFLHHPLLGRMNRLLSTLSFPPHKLPSVSVTPKFHIREDRHWDSKLIWQICRSLVCICLEAEEKQGIIRLRLPRSKRKGRKECEWRRVALPKK